MGLATHLGPWLLGTVKDTTGTTAGTVRNIGASTVSQFKTIAYNDAAASSFCVLPAGAFIRQIRLPQTTTFTSGSTGSVTVYLNGTSIGSASFTTGSAGVLTIAPTSDAMATLWTNIGTTDGVLTYTVGTATAGAGVLDVNYVVRLADGTYAPTSYTA